MAGGLVRRPGAVVGDAMLALLVVGRRRCLACHSSRRGRRGLGASSPQPYQGASPRQRYISTPEFQSWLCLALRIHVISTPAYSRPLLTGRLRDTALVTRLPTQADAANSRRRWTRRAWQACRLLAAAASGERTRPGAASLAGHAQ
jgi:hypothetical protein